MSFPRRRDLVPYFQAGPSLFSGLLNSRAALRIVTRINWCLITGKNALFRSSGKLRLRCVNTFRRWNCAGVRRWPTSKLCHEPPREGREGRLAVRGRMTRRIRPISGFSSIRQPLSIDAHDPSARSEWLRCAPTSRLIPPKRPLLLSLLLHMTPTPRLESSPANRADRSAPMILRQLAWLPKPRCASNLWQPNTPRSNIQNRTSTRSR